MAAINLTALGLTLIGGLILGVVPAIVAAFWAVGRLDRPAADLARGMWDEWRAEFLRSNIVALPPLVAAIAALMAMPFGGVVAGLLLLVAILSAAYALAALQMLAQVDGTAGDARANAALAFALAPWRHVLATALVPAALIIGWSQPPLALWFGLSVPCLLARSFINPALVVALPTETRACRPA
ncbi:YesL family protein [Jannaschia donghaensis]|nr:DUF624 domain-containing protein [Jannaschia donghaensis]